MTKLYKFQMKQKMIKNKVVLLVILFVISTAVYGQVKPKKIIISQPEKNKTVIPSTKEPKIVKHTKPPLKFPINIDMVYIQGGTFQMGSNDGQGDEKPVHTVSVSSFYMGKTEVTQAQWRAVMGNNPSSFKGDNLPVENVSWNDVQTFIEKLNQLTGKQYRLPTEAEWEFAARGGNKSKGTQYAGSNNVGNVAWYTDNSGSKTHFIASKQPNELGLYDMSGNVWEWCSDWYGDYSSSAQTNPKGASSGFYRVFRGGCWNSYANICRSAYRDYSTPDRRSNSLGFRLVSPK